MLSLIAPAPARALARALAYVVAASLPEADAQSMHPYFVCIKENPCNEALLKQG